MNADFFNILNELGPVNFAVWIKAFIFFVCGCIGMVMAYSHRWARDRVPVNWLTYMTGDKYEMGMAFIKLITACWVAGSFDYLQNLEVNAIITAGVLLGMTIPEKVDEEKAKNKAQAMNTEKVN
jgi:hypothetical protein